MIGLFCKRALWKRQYSAKETYNWIGPTNYSHPIFVTWLTHERIARGRVCVCVCVHTWKSHVTHDDAFICVTWLIIQMCDTTHFICVTCLNIFFCVMSHYSFLWHDPLFLFVSWLVIHLCVMTHLYPLFICVTRPMIHTCDMTHDSYRPTLWIM